MQIFFVVTPALCRSRARKKLSGESLAVVSELSPCKENALDETGPVSDCSAFALAVGDDVLHGTELSDRARAEMDLWLLEGFPVSLEQYSCGLCPLSIYKLV